MPSFVLEPGGSKQKAAENVEKTHVESIENHWGDRKDLCFSWSSMKKHNFGREVVKK